MLLGIGIVLGTLGYTGVWWGVSLWGGHPHSFAYGLGLSQDDSPPGQLKPGSMGSAVGGATSTIQKLVVK
jgi:hypothetical protein